MKNKILFLAVVVLSFVAIGSFKKETTFSDNNIKEETPKEEVKLAIKDSETGIVSNIDLEEYVIGVIAGEMPASFNVEALKAQAVAARTYAIYKMNNASGTYDLVTDITNQVYITKDKMKENWQEDYEYYYNKIKDAVNSTKDLIMTYNGNVICSFYFSTSNGSTEDARPVFGENKEYLKSVISPEKSSITKVTLTKEEFCNKLSLSCGEITVKSIEKTSSGRIDTLVINNKSFKGTEVRTKLGLRSTDFEINILANNIEITTKGYGHGVGMSQYGANTLADEGKTYEEILKHYYQNINIEKISV